MCNTRTLHVRGVALIVTNPAREVLIIREEQSKPQFGKYEGMFSPPMETSRAGEQDYSAIIRLVDEELPGLAGRVKIENKRRGVYRIVPGVWVSLYVGQTRDSLLPIPNESSKKEVGEYAWIPPENALALWLRQGAWEMLSDYVADRCGVVCRYCTPPSLSKASESM